MKKIMIGFLAVLLLGCVCDMNRFTHGDKIKSNGGRPGIVVDVADHLYQIEVLVRWKDDPKNPKWVGWGLIQCAETRCGVEK